jgi:hypothetical protein
MPTIQIGDKRVTYDDSPQTQRRVFEHVINWCLGDGNTHGDGIMQMDRPQETAAPMLAELVDEVIKFEVEYIEEDPCPI